LGLVVAIDLWVYIDAKALFERGSPVVFITDFVTIGSPAAWLTGCLLLGVVFIPLYIMTRRRAS
jgi:hypothetical protein